MFPAVLKDIVPGTVHSIITGITAQLEDSTKEKSELENREEKGNSTYTDFIEHFNPLELRLSRLSGGKWCV